jgi:heat shock protein HslJ
MTRTLTRLVAALALVLAACGDAGTGAAEGSGTPDGEWVLVEGVGPSGPIERVEGHVPTLTIDGEDWGGTVCNHYSAAVVIDGDEVTVEGVGGTEMACLADGAMESEAAYYAALSQVERYRRADDRLELEGPDVELVYDAVVPEPDAELEGTTWRLDALVEGGGPDGSVSSVLEEPTLELAGGQVTGDTGCNQFGGSYELEGERLRVGQLDQTLIGCDEALSAQETHVIGVLQADPTVRIEGPTLVLTAEDERGLIYRAG